MIVMCVLAFNIMFCSWRISPTQARCGAATQSGQDDAYTSSLRRYEREFQGYQLETVMKNVVMLTLNCIDWQGDLERKCGLPVSAMMDRATIKIAQVDTQVNVLLGDYWYLPSAHIGSW